MIPAQPIRASGARLVIACLATLALTLAACSAASPSGSGASQPLTIHLIERPTNGIGVPVGSLTGCKDHSCQGESVIGYDPVLDSTTNLAVGTLAYECFLVDTASRLFHCPGITVDLTGRGQITFTEFFYGGAAAKTTTAPITGGTGEFLGATGTVAIQQLPGPVGDYVFTITK